MNFPHRNPHHRHTAGKAFYNLFRFHARLHQVIQIHFKLYGPAIKIFLQIFKSPSAVRFPDKLMAAKAVQAGQAIFGERLSYLQGLGRETVESAGACIVKAVTAGNRANPHITGAKAFGTGFVPIPT